MLEHVRVVLVEPSHPGNIGAVARAMKTMGLSKLSLINPKQFPHEKATALASKADDILENATVFKGLGDAIADCELVLGFSARPRELDLPQLPLQDFGAKVVDFKEPVAILFGREHAGLTNNELSFCQYHLMIPSVGSFQSLNLSHAVQIACYEIRRAFIRNHTNDNVSKETKPYRKMASQHEIQGLFIHLEQTLRDIEFYQPEKSNKLLPKIKRLFNRAQLEAQEVNILRGILTAVNKQIPGNQS